MSNSFSCLFLYIFDLDIAWVSLFHPSKIVDDFINSISKVNYIWGSKFQPPTIFTSSIFEKLRTKMFTLTVVGSSGNDNNQFLGQHFMIKMIPCFCWYYWFMKAFHTSQINYFVYIFFVLVVVMVLISIPFHGFMVVFALIYIYTSFNWMFWFGCCHHVNFNSI